MHLGPGGPSRLSPLLRDAAETRFAAIFNNKIFYRPIFSPLTVHTEPF